MPLAAGSRLGPYEILSPLGAGGMGEVYRARDERLKRDVAVKVLPGIYSESPERLRRFEQEAQAASALNHPNILSIYDIGTHGGAPYIVSELLEGETLRARLAGGAFMPRRAIGHGLQIAQGLAAAHEKGIVHRDLKPENIFVTADERVKILDFGLAKLTQPESPGASQTNLPTATPGTEPGVVLGTMGYMSPEQVRGRAADARSDIFSFGAIFYEMLSGRRAFHGDTAADTISAILTKDPPDLSETNRRIPESLDRIVRHCLEKSPEARFHSASDIAFDLEAISGTSLVAAAGTTPGSVPWTARARRTLPWLALPLAALAFWAGRRSLAMKPAAPGVRLAEFRQLTFQPGQESFPALSPDGASFLYVGEAAGNSDIYLQRVGGQNPINLTKDSPDEDTQPAFSPAGDRIAFRSGREGGGIFVMGATGENVRRVTDFGFNPAWSPDGKSLVVSSEGIVQPFARVGYAELSVIDIETGRKRLLLSSEERLKRGGGDGVQPSWSPHGDRIAYWGIRGDTGVRDIFTIAAAGGPPVAVTNDVPTDWNPVWSPDGRHLFFVSDRGGSLNLWRVVIDERSGKTLAEPEPVTLPANVVGNFGFSRAGGQLIYMTQDARGSLFRVPFDARAERITGAPAAVLQTSMVISNIAISPDGQWIAFRPIGGGQEDLFLAHADGTGLRRMTDDPYRDRGPKFSPDGKRIGFYSNRSGRYDIWTMNVDGSGLTQITKNAAHGPWFPNWSPDGTRIAFPDGTNSYVFRVGAAPDKIVLEPLPPPPGGGWMQVVNWSPDGRMLVGQRQSASERDLLVYSIETKSFENLSPGERTPIGALPVFLADGRRILYLLDGRLWIVDRGSKKARALGGADAFGRLVEFVLTKDDRFIYGVDNRYEADVWEVTLK